MNRLLGSDFSQYNGSAYADNGMVNFDMQLGDGQTASIAYDENGNIKAMKQWGMKLTGSVVIDDMIYSYHTNSNKLRAVMEQGTGTTDHKLSDFTDKNTTTDDYGYDLNGNLLSDLNKRINGSTGIDQTSGGAIVYNHLNLPGKITVKKDDGSEKGTITYVYDAAGNKLKKITVDISVAGKTITTTTTYISGLVYEAKQTSPADANDYTDRLQFIPHEEGRTRYIATAGATPAHFEYDYFVKDHLGNIRMVLTEEQQTGIYQAGMETADRSFEVALFGDKVNSTATPKPGGFDGEGANQQVSRVNGTTAEGRVGPGVILKVMAGDKIKAHTFAWYQPTGMDNGTEPGLAALVTNLLAQLAPGIASAGKGTAAQQITGGILQPGMNDFLDDHPIPGGPKAYLNWILLDEEQFKKVEGSSSFTSVPVITGTQQKQLVQANSGSEIEMKKNGYLYVYVSNESRGNVYFDDIHIEHIQSSLIEETHYYPFGLTMAGISSKAVGKLENKYKFNDGNELQNKEFSDGSGLELYDANYRTYDPQLGRFHQIDPVAGLAYEESGYHFSNNNPIIYNDPLGLTSSGVQENITGWVNDPKKGVYFDPNVHDQKDVKPGQTYLGEEIIIKDADGNPIGYGNDQGKISFNVDLTPVTVTPANNYTEYGKTFDEYGLHPLILPKGTDYSDYGDFGGHTLYWISRLFESRIQYDIHGDVIGYNNIIGGVAPSAAFGKLNPKDALKLAKILKNLIRNGRAPQGVKRIDIPKLDGTTGLPLHGQQPHIHLTDGRALNFDGTWKHGTGEITNKIVKWIQENL